MPYSPTVVGADVAHGMVATAWERGWSPSPSPGAMGRGGERMKPWPWEDSAVLPHTNSAWRAVSLGYSQTQSSAPCMAHEERGQTHSGNNPKGTPPWLSPGALSSLE